MKDFFFCFFYEVIKDLKQHLISEQSAAAAVAAMVAAAAAASQAQL